MTNKELVAKLFVDRTAENSTIWWANRDKLRFDNEARINGVVHLIHWESDWAMYKAACKAFGRDEFDEAVKAEIRRKYGL